MKKENINDLPTSIKGTNISKLRLLLSLLLGLNPHISHVKKDELNLPATIIKSRLVEQECEKLYKEVTSRKHLYVEGHKFKYDNYLVYVDENRVIVEHCTLDIGKDSEIVLFNPTGDKIVNIRTSITAGFYEKVIGSGRVVESHGDKFIIELKNPLEIRDLTHIYIKKVI